MPLASTDAENHAVAGVAAVAGFFDACTGTPGTTGANEQSPASRQAITWGSAGGVGAGQIGNSVAITCAVAMGTTISYFGTWTLGSGGTYEIGGALSSSQTFGSAGSFTVPIGGLTIGAT